MKQLHVQLVILDDEDLLGHLGPGSVFVAAAKRGIPHPHVYIPWISLNFVSLGRCGG
jgi:hypothetical protein